MESHNGDQLSETPTADQIISRSRLGAIRREFPAQFLASTLQQIEQAAKSGDTVARKALKLLRDGRFAK